ncbi:hypothetical protein V2J09_015379 [Rumex salicifolius]
MTEEETRRAAREEREKALNEWLPITSNRNATWWFSAFHNVTAMVGAGVLGLPYAMSHLGWGPGIVIILLSWAITLFTLWQMVEMHEMVPGKRFDRYHELGQHAFGEKRGYWIVAPQQLLVQIGTDIVYMVTGGKCLKKFVEVAFPAATQLKLTYYIMIFASPHLLLSHIPNFNSISGISLAAAVMSLTYSTIAWVTSLHKGVIPGVEYTSRSSTPVGSTFGFLTALGDVAFAFAGHNVVLEIQATIPSTTDKPSKKAMMKGVYVAYAIVALCYFPVGFIGYWIFGNTVEDNILLSLERPPALIACANLFVVIHVVGSYQVYAMPVFDIVEAGLVRSLKLKPSKIHRAITLFTMFLGMTFPFFGSLMSFFGGLIFPPTSFYLPCCIWLALYKPKKFSLSWFVNWFCIVVGVLLNVLAPIGALRSIILQAHTYEFYS